MLTRLVYDPQGKVKVYTNHFATVSLLKRKNSTLISFLKSGLTFFETLKALLYSFH
jgi:hypothetical protein